MDPFAMVKLGLASVLIQLYQYIINIFPIFPILEYTAVVTS